MSGVNVLQRDDWRDQLTSVLPDFFLRPGQTACPIECGPGWAMVLDRLCVRIAATLEDRETFRFERIRSFRGALLVAWGGRLSAASEAAVRAAIDLAEARSMCVCELCGARGKALFCRLTCDLRGFRRFVAEREGFSSLIGGYPFAG